MALRHLKTEELRALAAEGHSEAVRRRATNEIARRERRFPILNSGRRLTVSWTAAEIAYVSYSRHYGNSQTLERLAERGGFGLHEFAVLFRGGDGGGILDERELVRALTLADIRCEVPS